MATVMAPVVVDHGHGVWSNVFFRDRIRFGLDSPPAATCNRPNSVSYCARLNFSLFLAVTSNSPFNGRKCLARPTVTRRPRNPHADWFWSRHDLEKHSLPRRPYNSIHGNNVLVRLVKENRSYSVERTVSCDFNVIPSLSDNILIDGKCWNRTTITIHCVFPARYNGKQKLTNRSIVIKSTLIVSYHLHLEKWPVWM